MRFIFRLILVLAAVYPFSMTPLHAHEGATGVVKERMDLMVSLGQAMKTLRAAIQREAGDDDTALIDAAARISAHSKRMQAMFPAGSMRAPSVARPEIWTDRSRFNTMADDLGKEVKIISDIIRNGDREGLMPQFRRIGAACSACHKSFRSRKKH
jgi:cytochrome c556